MLVRPNHPVHAIAPMLSALHLLSASAAVAEDRYHEPASLSVMTINTHFMWDGVESEDGSSRIGISWWHSLQEAEEHMAATAEVIARAHSGHGQPGRYRERDRPDHLERPVCRGSRLSRYFVQVRDTSTGQDVELPTWVDPGCDRIHLDQPECQSGAVRKSMAKNQNALLTGGDIMIVADVLSSGYLPLQVGNSWSFVVSAAGVEGQESIESAVRIDGNKYFRFSSFAGKDGTLLRLDSQNRLWERINGRDVLRYDFGAPLGTKWPYPGGFMILESRDETITTPAGTFARCVKFHYDFDGADGDWDEWYAPGVGPVKRMQYGYAIVSYALESFHTDLPN